MYDILTAALITATVQRGNTLSGIAAQYGTTVQALAASNGIADPNVIYAGSRLVIRGQGAGPALGDHDGDGDEAPGASAASHPGRPASPVQAVSVPSAGGVNWSAIAACESGGNWSTNTGNGFSGGLQFTQQTWQVYGGGQYASSASQASPAQQIAVAQRVLAGQGIGAWPVCGARG